MEVCIPIVVQDRKNGHADYHGRKHEFEDSKIGEQELVFDHRVIGCPAFVEEESKADTGDKAEYDLGTAALPDCVKGRHGIATPMTR